MWNNLQNSGYKIVIMIITTIIIILTIIIIITIVGIYSNNNGS